MAGVPKCIGGDGLHHVHNSAKKAFTTVFPGVIKFVNNIKYDINCSPAKLETYLEYCEHVGDRRTIPVSFCTSRFLDRFGAVRDALEHIDALEEYYRNANVPRSRGGKTNNYESESTDVEGEASDPELEEDLKENPPGRVKYMKKALGEQSIMKTEFDLMVSYCCLKPGYEFLLIFQGKSVKIHLLYAAFEKLLKEILIEICEPESLKDSKGVDLPGKELKCFKLENKTERELRKNL